MVEALHDQHGFVADVGHLTVFGVLRGMLRVTFRSPCLALPGAVEADGVDAGVAAHYGDPLREQKSSAGR
ncbi:MAG: hypothetical protein WKF82_12730 [Nocardioidaceae bacterium]